MPRDIAIALSRPCFQPGEAVTGWLLVNAAAAARARRVEVTVFCREIHTLSPGGWLWESKGDALWQQRVVAEPVPLENLPMFPGSSGQQSLPSWLRGMIPPAGSGRSSLGHVPITASAVPASAPAALQTSPALVAGLEPLSSDPANHDEAMSSETNAVFFIESGTSRELAVVTSPVQSRPSPPLPTGTALTAPSAGLVTPQSLVSAKGGTSLAATATPSATIKLADLASLGPAGLSLLPCKDFSPAPASASIVATAPSNCSAAVLTPSGSSTAPASALLQAPTGSSIVADGGASQHAAPAFASIVATAPTTSSAAVMTRSGSSTAPASALLGEPMGGSIVADGGPLQHLPSDCSTATQPADDADSILAPDDISRAGPTSSVPAAADEQQHVPSADDGGGSVTGPETEFWRRHVLYAFSCPLPPDLPSTYHSLNTAEIYYGATAELSGGGGIFRRGGKRMRSGTHVFMVVRAVPLNYVPEPVRQQKAKSFGSGRALRAVVQLSCGMLIPGTWNTVRGVVYNTTGYPLEGVKIVLLENLMILPDKWTRSEVQQAWPLIPLQDMGENRFEFNQAVLVPPLFGTSKTKRFRISYELLVGVQVSLGYKTKSVKIGFKMEACRNPLHDQETVSMLASRNRERYLLFTMPRQLEQILQRRSRTHTRHAFT